MSWLVSLTDDAWNDYGRLGESDQERLLVLLFDEWVPNGPTADVVRLSDGMIVRHKEFAPTLYVRFIVPQEYSVVVLRLLAGVI